MTEPLLSIENLRVSFATDQGSAVAVDGVSLSLEPGHILAIVGESGSGKSVTAKSILRMLPSTATTRGAIYLSGTEVFSLNAEELRDLRGNLAAMVFQEPSAALNPVYTVGWQIQEALRAHAPAGEKYSAKAGRARAIEILRKVGIPDPETRVDHFPHQFSGGQKQRIVIACALVLEPDLIIADEPTTALDVTVQAEILDLLRTLRDELNTTILIITHNMGVVADLADDVAVMYHGKVVEHAPVKELFAQPREAYTKQLLAAVPRVGGTQRVSAVRDGVSPVTATNLVIEYPGRFGRTGFRAVNDVSFTINPGEVVGLVGESGSGKTTIGRAIAGLTRISSGELNVVGTPMSQFNERTFREQRENIGFVFQDPSTSFNPLMTIAECIAEPLIVHGKAKTATEVRGRIDELLDAVELPTAYGERYPHELSGGQRQRASLARALVLRPQLVIADEPTSALDVSVQATVLELFGTLQRELGFASLFITHDLAVVDHIADSILVLYRGELVEEGNAREVLSAPKHPYTKQLLASLPIPDPVAQAKHREGLRALNAAARS
ncbi:MAG: ABC transporter ATP-binding protein [Microbacteriaceae bacterium]